MLLDYVFSKPIHDELTKINWTYLINSFFGTRLSRYFEDYFSE